MKVAVVGTGKVARENYLPFLAEREGMELCLWNRTRQRAVDVAESCGGEVADTLDAVAAWRPDTVLVLTAETARYDTSMSLLSLGVPRMFFEKPLVARNGQAHVDEKDFELGRDLILAAEAKGCATAMIFNYRFFEQTREAIHIATERDFGYVTEFTALVHYACWSHCLDLLQHFAGGVKRVSAMQSAKSRQGMGIDAPDLAAVVETESGGVGTVVGTAAMAWTHPLYEMTLNFERGRIQTRDIDGTLEILDAKADHHESRSHTRDSARWAQYRASFAASLGAYLDSIEAGAAPPIPGRAGLAELQFEAAMRRSANTGEVVELSRVFPTSA